MRIDGRRSSSRSCRSALARDGAGARHRHRRRRRLDHPAGAAVLAACGCGCSRACRSPTWSPTPSCCPRSRSAGSTSTVAGPTRSCRARCPCRHRQQRRPHPPRRASTTPSATSSTRRSATTAASPAPPASAARWTRSAGSSCARRRCRAGRGCTCAPSTVDPVRRPTTPTTRRRPAPDAPAAPRAAGAGRAVLHVRRHPPGRARRGAPAGRAVRLRHDPDAAVEHGAAAARATARRSPTSPSPKIDVSVPGGQPGASASWTSRPSRRSSPTSAGDRRRRRPRLRRVRPAAASGSRTARCSATPRRLTIGTVFTAHGRLPGATSRRSSSREAGLMAGSDLTNVSCRRPSSANGSPRSPAPTSTWPPGAPGTPGCPATSASWCRSTCRPSSCPAQGGEPTVAVGSRRGRPAAVRPRSRAAGGGAPALGAARRAAARREHDEATRRSDGPALPDRWVVVRTLLPEGARTAYATGWVIDAVHGAVVPLATYAGHHRPGSDRRRERPGAQPARRGEPRHACCGARPTSGARTGSPCTTRSPTCPAWRSPRTASTAAARLHRRRLVVRPVAGPARRRRAARPASTAGSPSSAGTSPGTATTSSTRTLDPRAAQARRPTPGCRPRRPAHRSPR